MEYLNETRKEYWNEKINYPKEYWNEKGECRYWLQVSVTSCRRCLFETLCHLEHDKEQREKEEREKEKSEQVLDHKS